MSTLFLARAHLAAGDLILVNRAHPYRAPAYTDLVAVAKSGAPVQMQRRAGRMLSLLLQRIGGAEQIVPVSGWRSAAEQQAIWDDAMQKHGAAFTNTYVAAPGCSEHQTGLAIDLGLKQEKIDFLRPAFPYAGICQTFRTLAPQYGFIERYPAGKEQITGIGHEPWHFRYIGVPHAAILNKEGLALEEYMDFLRQFPAGRPYVYEENGRRITVTYLRAEPAGETAFTVAEGAPYAVSGNNADGFILTQWGQGHA